MQAFSIRQLKNNPSTVLKAAHADAFAVVTNHDEPEALVVALDRLDSPDPAAVRSGLALSLLQSGHLSVGAAARLAGLPLARFLTLLSSLRIPVAGARTPADADAELAADLAAAKRWLGRHG
ncbi:MAG: type II toxin-antitoxin system Phd/YefM family antitoxin [Cyanobacteria bacterium K_DeepCast_35m_m2_023]|nr:type II toxin-antitoxin system Phd/YefM family antitoxin [Cyanobacteria bacterium K_DeepCast_35m_m2_023]